MEREEGRRMRSIIPASKSSEWDLGIHFLYPSILAQFTPTSSLCTYLHQNQCAPIEALVCNLSIVPATLEQRILQLHKVLWRASKIWELRIDLGLDVQLDLVRRVCAVKELEELREGGDLRAGISELKRCVPTVPTGDLSAQPSDMNEWDLRNPSRRSEPQSRVLICANVRFATY